MNAERQAAERRGDTWIAALRGLRDNPLARELILQRKRQAKRATFMQRWGLELVVALLGVSLVAKIAAIPQPEFPSLYWLAYGIGQAVQAILLIRLLKQLFFSVEACVGLLSAYRGRGCLGGFDASTALTPLTNKEMLLGVLAACLPELLRRMVVLSAFSYTAWLPEYFWDLQLVGRFATWPESEPGAFPSFIITPFVQIALASLSVTALLLYCINIGRGSRNRWLPVACAAFAAIWYFQPTGSLWQLSPIELIQGKVLHPMQSAALPIDDLSVVVICGLGLLAVMWCAAFLASRVDANAAGWWHVIAAGGLLCLPYVVGCLYWEFAGTSGVSLIAVRYFLFIMSLITPPSDWLDQVTVCKMIGTNLALLTLLATLLLLIMLLAAYALRSIRFHRREMG